MSTPLISICVPNLNKVRYLPERMETLLAQTFTDWEMIVCDSYSDDGSWELLQKYKSDPRIRLYQVPRHGIYAGWNECLQRAQGEYINIATSDDTASPCLLEKLIEPLERRRDIHLSVCDFQEIDAQSRPTAHRCVRFREFLSRWLNVPHIRSGKTEFLANTVFIATWYTMASVLFRRSLLTNTGLFRTDKKSFADTDWTLRASLATDIAHVPGQWTTFRLSPEQATPARNTPEHWRIYLDSLTDVLDEPGSRIPQEWKQVSGWRERLLQYRHNWYSGFIPTLPLDLKIKSTGILSGHETGSGSRTGLAGKTGVTCFSTSSAGHRPEGDRRTSRPHPSLSSAVASD